MRAFDRGITRKQVLQCFAAVVGFAAVFEPFPVSQEWWVYYGDQPLVVFGIPMWWWFANAAVVVGSAVLFTLARRHLFTADWQTVLFVPFAVVPLLVWHASAAFPVYAAISSDASMTVKTCASLLTIGFANHVGVRDGPNHRRARGASANGHRHPRPRTRLERGARTGGGRVTAGFD